MRARLERMSQMRAASRRGALRKLLPLCLAVCSLLLTIPSWGDVAGAADPKAPGPSIVSIQRVPDGSYRYVVNGQARILIGMGYNPIYRQLTDAQRAARYDRDFAMLCQAGVNTILGWDADKGYQQDKFDQLTLDSASRHDLGVVMPFYLPAEGTYLDPVFLNQLIDQAKAKVMRYKDHPALRMWGVGNEVLDDMQEATMAEPFATFYAWLADVVHALDPNHPVIFRGAEDTHTATMAEAAGRDGKDRPWLVFGANIYSDRLAQMLGAWPSRSFNKPLFVTEFGAEENWPGGRAAGYRDMWRLIRSHPEYVLGGAPYAWTIAGPEPTDPKWGLMDLNARPADSSFSLLSAEWAREAQNKGRRC